MERRALKLLRLVWMTAVAGILTIYALAIPYWFDDLHVPAAPVADPATYQLTIAEIAALERRGISLDVYAGAVVGAESVAVVLALIVAGVIFWRRNDDWLALAVGLWLILIPTSAPAPPGAVLVDVNRAWFVPVYAYYAMFMITQMLAFTLFPTRRFHSRWLGWLALGWMPVALLVLHPRLTWVESPPAFGAAIGSHYAIAITGIVQQYRHTATVDERHQVKWALFGMIGGFTIAFVSIIFRIVAQDDPFLHVVANLVGVATFFMSLVALDIGFGFSILRYRLWDIDLVINRSLVYGALTGLLLALVGGSLLTIAWLFDRMAGGQQSLLAMAVAGLTFGLLLQPVRRRVQRLVDRRVYGIAIDYHNIQPTLPDAPLRPMTTQIGAFANLQLVGRGGMADVYRGEHPTLRQPVAVKVLPAVLAASPRRRKQFERESRAAAALHHPNIVHVFEHGEANGMSYLVMEFISGPDLGQLVQQRGALSLDEALPIVEQIASALDYAHGHGVVHCDVKPSNVMLEDGGSRKPGRVVLMDFGIAKMLDETTQITSSGVMGTLAYIAPEQIQAPSHVDGRADIYALGVMAYQMLTGQLPFQAQTPLAMLMSHLNQPPPDPCHLRPMLGHSSCASILRAMEKDPERRFAAAGEFARALRH